MNLKRLEDVTSNIFFCGFIIEILNTDLRKFIKPQKIITKRKPHAQTHS